MPEFEIQELVNQFKTLPHSFFTVAEVSEHLRVSYCTVWRMVISGELAASKFGGQWRITKSSLVKYLQSRHPFNLAEEEENECGATKS